MAASIAAVIFQAGRNRVMKKHAQLMYHNAYGSDDMKSMDAINDSIAQMIADNTKKEIREIKSIMNQTTWINADDAEKFGFCDKVEDTGDVNINSGRQPFKNKTEVYNLVKEYNNVYDSILTIKNENMTPQEMQKINAALKLHNDSALETTVAEILNLQNKSVKNAEDCKNAEDALKEKKDDLDKVKSEFDAMKNEFEKTKNEVDKTKAEAEEVKKEAAVKEEEAKKMKAKNAVEDLVKNGKVKNEEDAIKNLEDKFTNDFEGMNKIFNSLTLNKTAPKIIYNSQKNGTEYKGSLIAMTMAMNELKGEKK
jgi:DNA repair exonuclease SbcCD ATPase subunit